MPTFAIMNVKGGAKKHVPMRFADDEVTPEGCARFFADPAEAKRSLGQAHACPDMELVLGVVPLGHALALVVGWADGKGSAPFTIRGSEKLTKDVRAHLKKQLKKLGMPAYWQIPVILCDELTTAAVMPVFLEHASLAAAARRGGRGHSTSTLKIFDLRARANDPRPRAVERQLDDRPLPRPPIGPRYGHGGPRPTRGGGGVGERQRAWRRATSRGCERAPRGAAEAAWIRAKYNHIK